MPAKKLLLSGVVVAVMAALLMARAQDNSPSGERMIAAAQQFLDTLSQEQRQQATFPYDGKERLNWHYVPRERKGVALRAVRGKAEQAFRDLLASGLSEIGYGQALDVMSLEEVLYLLGSGQGDRANRRERRDPEKYYISIFGKPSDSGTWGWRVEGHHLSLNYSITDGDVTATTPEFFGANPTVVDGGPGRSLAVLGPEEDLARQILKLCNPKQQKLAWISKEAPEDIRAAGDPQPPEVKQQGLPVAKMSSDQKKLFSKLLREYLANMPPDVRKERRQRINAAGLEKITFAWWGSDQRNEGHHYRIIGPTFLVQYNNTQNSANHIHSVWRKPSGDFNIARED